MEKTVGKLCWLLVTVLLMLSERNEAKSCKILKEQVVYRENYAFSGKLVRVKTTVVKFQQCKSDQPNCCGKYGCCDERGSKLFFMVLAGAVTGCLFLAVTTTFMYSVLMNRSDHQRGETQIKAVETTVQPRFSTKTYLTMAGVNSDDLKASDQPRSAIAQPLEFEVDKDESSDVESSSDSSSD